MAKHLLIVVAFVQLGGCRGTTTAVRSSEPETREVSVDEEQAREKLEQLDALFATTGPIQIAGESPQKISRAFVSSRLRQDAFYHSLAYGIFDLFSFAGGDVASDDGRHYFKLLRVTDGVFHLQAPCSPADQESVVPWWNKNTTVKVCEDSYRPKVEAEVGPEVTKYCELPWLKGCGCGPNLVYCIPGDQYVEVVKDVHAEPIRLIQDVISARRPFSEILTARETRRTALLDPFYYRGRTDKLVLDPAELSIVKKRDRPEEFAGGIISTPFAHNYDDQRTVLSAIYSDFMCLPFVSVTVKAEETMALDSSTLRFEGLMELSSKKGCEGCHARLEHGLLAFSGFVARDQGGRYVPQDQHQGDIAFKVYDNKDQRATGPATIHWFLQTMTEQPEFTDCVVSKVESWVYAGSEVAPDAHQVHLDSFNRTGQFDALLSSVIASYLSEPQ